MRTKSFLGVVAWLALAGPSRAQTDCESLRALIRESYGFRPSQLKAEEFEAKNAAMDRVWKEVEAHKLELAPCLRAAIDAATDDPWFRIDGASLLVHVDPTAESRALQVNVWTPAPFEDLDPSVWMRALAQRGFEGLDTSQAARRWLAETDETFAIPEHALTVGRSEGALFLFGSMDESFATPMLKELAAKQGDQHRAIATELLALQATKEALKALEEIEPATFASITKKPGSKDSERTLLVEKRSPGGRVTRKRLLDAFRAYVEGDTTPLEETQMLEGGKWNERWPEQVASALRAEDVPLLRQVRRKRMTGFSDEALEEYATFTRILTTLVWSGSGAK